MTSTIILKVDSKLKKDAQKIAKKMGLTLTFILNKFLEDFVRTRSTSFKQF